MRLIPVIDDETYDKLISHGSEYLEKHGFKKYAGRLYYGVTYKKGTTMGTQHRKPHFVEIVAPRDKNKVLKELYDKDLLRLGRDSFFSKIRMQYGNITRQNAIDFLRTQEPYQLHLQQPRERTVRPVSDTKINSRWQMDHIDMKNVKSPQNNNAAFIFVVIDTFSKYVWAKRVTKKDAAQTKAALKEFLEDNKKITGEYPRVIQSDNAKEFNACDSFLRSYGIEPIHSPSYTPQAQGIVERFNRTLKNAIYLNFTKRGQNKYTDILPEIVKQYNHAYHTTIKDTPARIHKAGRVSVKQQELVAERNKKWMQSSRKYPPIKVGDKVRLTMLVNDDVRKGQVFAKKYKQQWSNEVYTVVYIVGENSEKVKPTYQLKLGNVIYDKTFYRRDLQLIA